MEGLEIRQGELQNTLNVHVQQSTDWWQQQQQWQDQQQQLHNLQMEQITQMNERMRMQHEQQPAYWRSLGYNPDQ